MDLEEKKLQIELAKLQADIQISLTVLIGFFAALLSLIVYSSQMYNTLLDSNPLKSIYGSSTGIAIIALFVLIILYAPKLKAKRNAMDKL